MSEIKIEIKCSFEHRSENMDRFVINTISTILGKIEEIPGISFSEKPSLTEIKMINGCKGGGE